MPSGAHLVAGQAPPAVGPVHWQLLAAYTNMLARGEEVLERESQVAATQSELSAGEEATTATTGGDAAGDGSHESRGAGAASSRQVARGSLGSSGQKGNVLERQARRRIRQARLSERLSLLLSLAEAVDCGRILRQLRMRRRGGAADPA